MDAHCHDGKIRCYLSIHCDKDVTHCVCDMIPGTLVLSEFRSRYAQCCYLLYNDAKYVVKTFCSTELLEYILAIINI